jgi:hypothetical protein
VAPFILPLTYTDAEDFILTFSLTHNKSWENKFVTGKVNKTKNNNDFRHELQEHRLHRLKRLHRLSRIIRREFSRILFKFNDFNNRKEEDNSFNFFLYLTVILSLSLYSGAGFLPTSFGLWQASLPSLKLPPATSLWRAGRQASWRAVKIILFYLYFYCVHFIK